MKKIILEGVEINVEISISNHIFEKLCQNNNSKYINKLNEDSLILKKSYFSIEHQVPNVIRYSLYKTESNSYIIKSDIKKDILNSNFNDKKLNSLFLLLNKKPIIVIILESPHKDEFDLNFSPKGPAQGVTGVQLCEKLEGVINKHLSILNLTEEECKVAIINPVPVQTSLFHFLKEPISNEIKILRDEIWNILWNEEELQFKTKFNKLISDPNVKIIINACTMRYKEVISDEIKLVSEMHYTSYHPSSWTEREIDSINLNLITND